MRPAATVLEVPRDESAVAEMAREVREGLLRRPLPEIPSKYRYDDRGSALFDEITRQPEYYPTRTEEAILERSAADIVQAVQPQRLAEIGSGAGRKIRLLLDEIGAGLESVTLFDINADMLRGSMARLRAHHPEARYEAIVGDFLHDLKALGPGGGRLVLFLAGTIGNLPPVRVPAFLRAAAQVVDAGDGFLVGIDLVKDTGVLEAAYNDAAGVTAQFNRNILRVVDERLGADFDPADFDHVAFYDRANAWIEMRLRARRAVRARVPAAGIELALARGEEIRTELSCKYSRASLLAHLEGTGLRLDRWFSDERGWFADVLLRRA